MEEDSKLNSPGIYYIKDTDEEECLIMRRGDYPIISVNQYNDTKFEIFIYHNGKIHSGKMFAKFWGTFGDYIERSFNGCDGVIDSSVFLKIINDKSSGIQSNFVILIRNKPIDRIKLHMQSGFTLRGNYLTHGKRTIKLTDNQTAMVEILIGKYLKDGKPLPTECFLKEMSDRGYKIEKTTLKRNMIQIRYRFMEIAGTNINYFPTIRNSGYRFIPPIL